MCDQNIINNAELKSNKNAELKLNKNNKKNITNKIMKTRILKSQSKNKTYELTDKLNELLKNKNNLKFKYEQWETYEHSDFYIITNNLNYSIDELKKIYKKRWTVEASFKFDKTKLNLNQMNNKNINLIKQNVYIIQFIHIINGFIDKLLEKIIKKDHSLNKTMIFKSYMKTFFYC